MNNNNEELHIILLLIQLIYKLTNHLKIKIFNQIDA